MLITGEALAATAGGSFGWPRELAGQRMRLGLADRGSTALGIRARRQRGRPPARPEGLARGDRRRGRRALRVPALVGAPRARRTARRSRRPRSRRAHAPPHRGGKGRGIAMTHAASGSTKLHRLDARRGDGMAFDEIIYEKKHHTELRGRHRARHHQQARQAQHHDAPHRRRDVPRASTTRITIRRSASSVGGGGRQAFRHRRRRRVGALGPPRRVLQPLPAQLASSVCRASPCIAQVQGYCLGGHNHMAYVCDFTIAADNRDLRPGRAARSRSPADGYFVPFLTKVVGHKKAREMWMLCRRYPALEALDMGLVNRVVPLDRLEAEVDAWCGELFLASPGCLEVLKAAFDQEMDGYQGARCDLEQPLPRLVRHAGGKGRRERLRREAEAALLRAPRARGSGASEARRGSTRTPPRRSEDDATALACARSEALVRRAPTSAAPASDQLLDRPEPRRPAARPEILIRRTSRGISPGRP